MTAARMLAQLRMAVFAIFLLAVTAMAWHDARPVLLALIAVVALWPVIVQADQPDPDEEPASLRVELVAGAPIKAGQHVMADSKGRVVPMGFLCETCGDMAVGMRDGGHYCERHMILPADPITIGPYSPSDPAATVVGASLRFYGETFGLNPAPGETMAEYAERLARHIDQPVSWIDPQGGRR